MSNHRTINQPPSKRSPLISRECWKPPFQPWFEGDFSGSFNVRKMKPLARLMYRSLLAQAWHSDNPPYLPNNEADLILMADAPTPEDWAGQREVILARFQTTDDGQWLFHPKAVREYDRARHEHDRKALAGKRRWAGHAQQELGKSIPLAQHPQADVAPLSPHNHNQSTTTTNKTISSKDSAFDQALEDIWTYYLVKLSKNPAIYRFTTKRHRKGKARLEECCRVAVEPKLENAVQMMQVCIDRLAASPFHNGENRDGKKYLDWDCLFRSEEKLSYWLDDQNHQGKTQR